MSLPAIIVMIASMIALWGVAAITLVHSMRQEDRKLVLLQEQGGFEPFSFAAQRDMETWLSRHPEGKQAKEMRELLETQKRARHDNAQLFYHWPNS